MSTPPRPWLLRAERLRRFFGGRCGVDSVSFELTRGETLGFLGPNGAGKSTTLQLMAGVLLPDSGGIQFASGHSGAAQRAHTGLAPQSLAFYRELGVEDNLRFFGGLYGLKGPRLRGRVEWALTWVGLASRRTDRAGTLSGGMQRRLNLACAAVHEPELLLLDEPTAGVDAASRELVFESLQRLRQRGVTVVYSTHHVDEVERLCDRVALFERGRIVAIEPVPKPLAESRVSRAINRRIPYTLNATSATSEAE
jgi:ABC-2 type transport system ATP-binding protein